jgi:hypothetical protein
LLEFEVHMVGKVKTKTYKKTPKWKKSQQEPWNVPIIILNHGFSLNHVLLFYIMLMTGNQKKKTSFFVF